MTSNSYLHPRIGLLLFLQYFGGGSWIVTLGYYMSHTLKFDHIIGAAYGMFGVAGLLSSLFAGVLADYFFSSQKLVAYLMLGAAAALLALVLIDHSTLSFLVTMLVLSTCVMALTPLITSLAMSLLDDPVRQFPSIRACGTSGWIVSGLAIGFWPGAAATNAPMLLAAAIYFISGLYCFTLPNVSPSRKGGRINIGDVFGLDLLRNRADKALPVFFVSILTIAIPMRFYDSLFNTFLAEKTMTLTALGVTLEPTGIQTMGQMIEVATLILLAPLISRLGFKRVMIIGIIAWIGRFLLFGYGFEGDRAIKWFILLGIFMHGLSYDLLFVTGQLWLEKHLGSALRNRAQSLYNFIYNGIGVIIGSNIAGFVFAKFTASTGERDWLAIWLVPAACATITLVYFILKFNYQSSSDAQSIASNDGCETSRSV